MNYYLFIPLFFIILLFIPIKLEGIKPTRVLKAIVYRLDSGLSDHILLALPEASGYFGLCEVYGLDHSFFLPLWEYFENSIDFFFGL